LRLELGWRSKTPTAREAAPCRPTPRPDRRALPAPRAWRLAQPSPRALPHAMAASRGLRGCVVWGKFDPGGPAVGARAEENGRARGVGVCCASWSRVRREGRKPRGPAEREPGGRRVPRVASRRKGGLAFHWWIGRGRTT
jgi:hypothetical protein